VEESYVILSYFALFIPAVPLGVALVRRRALSAEQWWLVALAAWTLLTGLLGEWIAFREGNNLWVFHLFFPVELTLMLMVYARFVRPLIRILIGGGFAAFSVVNVIFLQSADSIPSIPMTLECLPMIGLSILFFWTSFREMKLTRLERHPLLWISTGNLVYFAGNLFFFIFSHYILQQDRFVFLEIWNLNCLLLILRYLMYAIALLCRNPN
jgi:hypothetical protein